MNLLDYDAYIKSMELLSQASGTFNYIDVSEADALFDGVKVCSFTGHRPEKMDMPEETADECINLKFAIRKEIIEAIRYGFTTFITGMARGVDIWAAEAVLETSILMGKHITLYAAIPYPEQPNSWFGWEQERYEEVLSLCKGIFLVSNKYTSYCMEKRNHFLVKYAGRIIAVFDGQDGGTANTVALAKKKGIKTVIIDPKTLDKTEE